MLRDPWFIVILSLSVFTCKKAERDTLTPEEKERQLLEANAEYNGGIVPDLGNVYFAKTSLYAGKAARVTKVDFQEGTLACYATVNGDHAIDELYAMVFSYNQGSQIAAEVDTDGATFRAYAIQNGQRSNLVLQAQLYSPDEKEVRLLDVNWATGETAVLAGSYYRGDEAVAGYQAASRQMGIMAGAREALSSLCTKPSPTTDVAEAMDLFIPFFSCYAKLINQETAIDLVGKLSGGTDGSDAASAVLAYINEMAALDQKLARVAGKFSRFKTNALAAGDADEVFERKAIGTDTVMADRISLRMVEAESVLEWDDSNDISMVVLTLLATDKATGEAHLRYPMYVDARVFLDTDTGASTLFEETQATDPKTGKVVFTYNPRQGNVVLKPTDRVTVHYQVSALQTGDPATLPITVVDNIPAHISIVSGNSQEADWESALAEPLKARVTAKSGRVLKNVAVKWTVIGGGQLSQVSTMTDASGITQASYTTGRQIDPKGRVMVEARGPDAQPIPNVKAVFDYKQKKYNFSLLQLKYLDDQFHTGKREVERTWKDGSTITVYHSQFCLFWVELDGELIRDPDGKPHEFGFNMQNIGLDAGYHPFQSADIKLPNLAVRFPNPLNGATDSVVINLTISNELYRSVVGKTFRLEGTSTEAPPGYVENGNAGEVLTYTYLPGNKVQITSLLNPQGNGIYDYEVGLHYGYAPLYDCNAEMTHTMKKVIGVIGAHGGGAHYGGVSGSLILFADGSVEPLTIGSGTIPCQTRIYWKNISFK